MGKLVSSTIPNLISGVSQQPWNVRLPTQAEEQVNCQSSVTDFLKRRPATRHLARIRDTPAANGIANANLIRPGQVLTIPPLAQLPAAAARPPSAQIAAATKVREVKEEESGTARLVPWVPENTVKSLADLELDKIASGGGLWQSTRW